MTTLTSRPAQLGPTINDRTEMHGDEGKPALDLTISGFVLSQEELNAIAQHPGAYAGLFDTSSNPPRWAYPGLAPTISLADTIKGCEVTLKLGLEMFELRLAGANVKGGAIACEQGVPALSCKVQFEGELTGEQLLKLRAAKGKSIDVEFVLGAADAADDTQADLPLNTFGEGEEAEGGKRRRGRKGNGHTEASP
jgi:hypothetical protein